MEKNIDRKEMFSDIIQKQMTEFITGTKKRMDNGSSQGQRKYTGSNPNDLSNVEINYDMTHIEQWN